MEQIDELRENVEVMVNLAQSMLDELTEMAAEIERLLTGPLDR